MERPAMTRRRAAAIVRAFDEAAQSYAFKGAAHPDDWDAITARYQSARQRLINHLMK